MTVIRQLTGIRVRGLLGRFDHEISFPEDDEFIILHGPNGVGKTMLLELIRALSGPLRLPSIQRIPFSQIRLGYSDGSRLDISRAQQETLPLGEEYEKQIQLLFFSLRLPDGQEFESEAGFDGEALITPRFREWAYRYLNVEPLGPDLWETPAGSTISTVDLVHRYGDRLPHRILRQKENNVDPNILQFLHDNEVHLIETQRLLKLEDEESDEYRSMSGRRSPAVSKVEAFARDLTRRLGDALAENSRTSQELDRTYPRRVLQPRVGTPSEKEIRERYSQQNELRKSLSAISLLDENVSPIEIPNRMEPWQRNVLWTYLEDAEKKLSTFSDILDKVSLLQEIVSTRFLFKRLEIDRRQGLRIVSDEGTELGLSMLSSGEQHELVLLYDLLFSVQPGALVLIDEPEISLHVSWQKRFIEDLQRIARLVKFRSVVATHSPQIAGKWVNRMVPLGPETTD
ncbi:AAA family ATPase [Streptomyces sp. HNM0575]|uniref:AAA family ATPase n=1 Tax=Streptomyces sp. HNM0575 TaxID=2716338 RepID=UPI00145ECAAB|nr:AAA family ATPase [Streptomyces sp. HNM0575]NLU74434.1 AAA family ATPase [Streptomyces sp. HNM0575]